MEWVECLNRTITYMEDHLTEEIDYEGKVPSLATRSHSAGRVWKFFSMSFSMGTDTPTTRNASRFSIRYSISSAPLIMTVKRSGGKLFTETPGSRTAEGGTPWTA